MKVSIGSKIVLGPWGGGNLFAINLTNYLLDKGHEVIYNLTDSDIDLILLTDPRSRRESSSTFNHYDIEQYKKYVNPNVKVVQRINECDERKNTNNINDFYLNATKVADHVVFVSSWLREIYTKIGLEESKSSVILAGANPDIFNTQGFSKWDSLEPLKIVTHHWSSHENKGFDVYQEINDLISEDRWKNKIEFTYIGNMNNNFVFNNSKIITPLAGKDLASELKKNHVYVTASINEPSGNHHIEAAQCGLPIIFKNSGGIPEYCQGFGISFDESFENALNEMYSNYQLYHKKLKKYPFNSLKMCQDFLNLFVNLTEDSQKGNPRVFYFMKHYTIFKNKYISIIRNYSMANLKNKILNLLRRKLV